MSHGAVAVPEEDASGADILQDVTNLRDYRVGSTADDRVIGDLLLVGPPQHAGNASASAAGRGSHCLGGQHPPAGCQTRQVDQGGVHCAFVACQEGVAGTLHVFPARLFGQFLGLVNVHLPKVAKVLRSRLVAHLGGGIVV